MKKLISLVLSLVLLCAALPVLAEDAGRILAVDCHYGELKDMNPQFKGGESSDKGCLGMSPVTRADGTFAEAYMRFDVTVDTAGLYEVTVRYAAKGKAGQTRCADLVVNDGERIHLPITGQADWDVYMPATVLAHLNAGDNALVIKNVEGFDNNTLKAINVDYLAWKLVAPAADEGRILAVDAEATGLKDMNPQFKGGESSDKGCLGLNPATNADGTFADGKLTFYVDVNTAGAYDLTVRYAAKGKAGQTRCADLIVNDGERIRLPITGQADWDVYMPAKVTVDLAAGLNVIVLTNVEGFDNNTLKAINVDYLGWKLVPAAE